VGVDLGGTNIRAAEVFPDGTVGRTVAEPVSWDLSDLPFAQLLEVISQVVTAASSPPLGIGLGVTGPVHPRSGIIANPYTLPPSYQGHVRAPLNEHFGVPVVLENDANVAAIAEARFGAGRGRSSTACVTVGTGIGVGVVLDGAVHRGPRGLHPEAGHMVIDANGPQCYCGARGCVESLASATAVMQAARTAGIVGPDATARDVHEASRQGDEGAAAITGRAHLALALCAANLVAVHAVDTIVFAGNAVGDGEALIAKVMTVVSHSAFAPPGGVVILESRLGGYTGCIGAASLVLRP